MKYIFNDEDLSLVDRLCSINNVNSEDLDVSAFEPDYDLEILKKVYEELLSDKDKRFFIVGDYDCDGICSTVIMTRLLNHLSISSNYYIPSRTKQGYGLNKEIIDTASKHGFDVLMCVDNGAAFNEELKYARSLGLKTYVIDHHEYLEVPETDCFVHPNLFSSKYNDMCASGLSCLIASSIYEDDLNTVYGGLATLADMVSVFGYNRYLLKKMLEILKKEDIIPLGYLLGKNEYSYDALSYNVIPKINAVSRLDDMMNVNYVVKYLLDNSSECMKYLNKIEEINTSRKTMTKQMSALAERIIDPSKDMIIVRSSAFKEGLCGLIANKLMYEFGKPVLVLSENNNELKGSGRSPKGSDLYTYLKNAEGIFKTFGGHAQAVGLSLDASAYEDLLKYVDDHSFLYDEQYKTALVYEVTSLDENLLKQIEELKPYGTDFSEPLLCIDGQYQKKYTVAGMYPKYVINDNLEAISFNHNHLGRYFSKMLGHLKRDDYHKGKLSFVIEDLI